MNFHKPGRLHRLCLMLGICMAAPAWACTDPLDPGLTVNTTGVGVVLTTTVDKSSARPGDLLQYTLNFCNAGDAVMSDMEISNATPAFTDFVAASCGTLPADMTCSISAQPALGSSGTLLWALNGALSPGASGTVNFVVSVR